MSLNEKYGGYSVVSLFQVFAVKKSCTCLLPDAPKLEGARLFCLLWLSTWPESSGRLNLCHFMLNFNVLVCFLRRVLAGRVCGSLGVSRSVKFSQGWPPRRRPHFTWGRRIWLKESRWITEASGKFICATTRPSARWSWRLYTPVLCVASKCWPDCHHDLGVSPWTESSSQGFSSFIGASACERTWHVW